MSSALLTLAGVAIFGGLGSALRLVLANWYGRLPWGILAGNTVASFIVGYATSSGFSGSFGSHDGLAGSYFWVTVLATGLAGGLSTFSSWAAQTIDLMADGHSRAGFYNFLLNLALPVLAVIVGLVMGGTLLK